jgi:cytochrome P450 family 135
MFCAARSEGLPPGPSLPAAVQGLLLTRRPLHYLHDCMRRYGSCFTIRLPSQGPIIFIADPVAARALLTADVDQVLTGDARAPLRRLVGDRSFLVTDGEEPRLDRRSLGHAFKPEGYERYGSWIQELTDRELSLWPVGRSFQLRPRMRRLTQNVILRMVLGAGADDQTRELRSLLYDLLGVPDWPLVTPLAAPRLGRLRRSVRSKLVEVIHGRIVARNWESDSDVLAALLRAGAHDGEGSRLPDTLLGLLVSGHATTATALAWSLELLLHHPAALARVQSETAEGGGAYLDAVIREVLRLRPVFPAVVRRLAAPRTVGAYTLPEGALAAAAITLIHHSADLYPDPDSFLPERFLESKPPLHAWMPFGGGARGCLGAGFAMYEMSVVLRTVLMRAALRPIGRRPEAARLTGVTLVPARGARVVLEKLAPATAGISTGSISSARAR